MRTPEELEIMLANWQTVYGLAAQDSRVDDTFPKAWVLALSWALNKPVIIN